MTAVDVVIVTFNSSAHLRDCIDAVRRWERTGRVIVVDNASTDDSRAIAAAVADEVITCETNRGYGAGQNLGAARVTTQFFLALNPDARVVPAGLEAGFELLRVRDDVAAVQGVVRRAADHDLERTFGREPGLADLVAHRLRLRQRVGERVLRLAARFVGLRHFAVRLPDAATVPTPFLAAVAPLIRAAAFAEVGGFDEDYFLYAEDVDLSRRLRRAGWSLLSMTDPWAEHQGGASSAGTPGLRDRYWWQAHRRLVEKHWTGMRRAAGLALTHAYAGTRP